MIIKKRKEYDYFDYFHKSAGSVCEAAACLHGALQTFQETTFEHNMKQVHTLRNKADDDRYRMMQTLAQEFIPPLEHEDILRTAQGLGHIIGDIDGIMRQFYMFRINKITPEALEYSAFIVKGTAAVKEAAAGLRNFKKSRSLAGTLTAVSKLKSGSDTLHMHGVRNLFGNANDPVKKLIWTTIYEEMENCMNDCENTAEIIESVIIKNL